MEVTYTNDVVFSFNVPNLCLLGDEIDFRKLAACHSICSLGF